MRNYVNQVIRVLIGTCKLEGVFLGEGQGEEKGLFLIRGKDGVLWHIPKGQMTMFSFPSSRTGTTDVPGASDDGESSRSGNSESLKVLCCANRGARCSGVQFVISCKEPSEDDFELFMEACPSRGKGCARSVLGELKSINDATLTRILANTRFGEYPSEKQ
jgi:hypothetical protein